MSPTAVATTGVPVARASITTTGRPSWCELRTSRSARASRAGTSSRVPSTRRRAGAEVAATPSSSASTPWPTIQTSRWGSCASARSAAATRSSWAFSGRRLPTCRATTVPGAVAGTSAPPSAAARRKAAASMPWWSTWTPSRRRAGRTELPGLGRDGPHDLVPAHGERVEQADGTPVGLPSVVLGVHVVPRDQPGDHRGEGRVRVHHVGAQGPDQAHEVPRPRGPSRADAPHVGTGGGQVGDEVVLVGADVGDRVARTVAARPADLLDDQPLGAAPAEALDDDEDRRPVRPLVLTHDGTDRCSEGAEPLHRGGEAVVERHGLRIGEQGSQPVSSAWVSRTSPARARQVLPLERVARGSPPAGR